MRETAVEKSWWHFVQVFLQGDRNYHARYARCTSARKMPIFLPKKCLSYARFFFTKLSPYEELGTLLKSKECETDCFNSNICGYLFVLFFCYEYIRIFVRMYQKFIFVTPCFTLLLSFSKFHFHNLTFIISLSQFNFHNLTFTI